MRADFVRVDARVERRVGRGLELTAEAREVGGERTVLATGRASFVRVEDEERAAGA